MGLGWWNGIALTGGETPPLAEAATLLSLRDIFPNREITYDNR